MSALGCPFCGATTLKVVAGSVVCGECAASGPWVAGDDRGAERRWNQRVEGEGEPTIRIEESENELGGMRLSLYYGTALCVLVEHVPEAFATTMRGALVVIGGMAKAHDLEDDA